MTWTDTEIEEYRNNKSQDPVLRMIYLQARIPADKPEKRARYLAEEVLKLPKIDHVAIMNLAKKSGKVHALIRLEKIFCEFY